MLNESIFSNLLDKLKGIFKSEDSKSDKLSDADKALADLIIAIRKDFIASPYSDKISIENDQYYGNPIYKYTFERYYQDDSKWVYTFNIDSHEHRIIIHFETHKGKYKMTLSSQYYNDIIKFLNDLTRKCKTRPTKIKNTQTDKNSSHPKFNQYKSLKDTFNLRKEELSKMKNDDPDRASRENELEVLSKKISDFKSKYHFEHLKSFESFKLK